MSVYKNNKDGTLSMIATDITIENAHTEDFLTKSEFSAVTPNDISANNKLVAENEVTKAVDTMPIASADLVGTIVQYIGTTTANYTNGYFYKCVSDGAVTPTYSWVEVVGSGSSPLVNIIDSPTVGNTGGIVENATREIENYDYDDDIVTIIPNVASGDFSHAEGMSIKTENDETFITTASGLASHAEGQGTVASGECSHAEGGGTTASGNASHAEGNSTTASSVASHAEGSYTTASGLFSHTEGGYTNASGDFSHAEGKNTTAGYDYQHVQGKYNDNKSDTFFEIGNGENNGNRHNIFEIYSDGSLSQNNGTDKYKFAKNNNVDGFYDGTGTFHAFGEDRMTINGSNSADLVRFNNKVLVCSVEYDNYSVSSIVKPSGANQTVTITLNNNTVKNFVNAIVNTAFASSMFYILINDEYKALTAISISDTSPYLFSCTLVDDITDEINITTDAKLYFKAVYKDIHGLQVGFPSITAKNSMTVGNNNIASGINSTATGYYTVASGNGSHAEGYTTTAEGYGSHTEGGYTKTTSGKNYGHAEGYYTTAGGDYTHAEGSYTTAGGYVSHAEGYYTNAGYNYQHVSGRHNDNKSTTLLEIGNGIANARSNAFEVYKDGSLSTDNGTTKTKLPVIKSKTLAANATSVIFDNMPSSGNNLIQFYTDKAGLDYTAITTSGTDTTLTYPAQSSDTTVYCSIVEVM